MEHHCFFVERTVVAYSPFSELGKVSLVPLRTGAE